MRGDHSCPKLTLLLYLKLSNWNGMLTAMLFPNSRTPHCGSAVGTSPEAGSLRGGWGLVSGRCKSGEWWTPACCTSTLSGTRHDDTCVRLGHQDAALQQEHGFVWTRVLLQMQLTHSPSVPMRLKYWVTITSHQKKKFRRHLPSLFGSLEAHISVGATFAPRSHIISSCWEYYSMIQPQSPALQG